MKYHFELYILSGHLTADHWQKLYAALLAYLGVFSRFQITFISTDNIVRFFVSCNKDLGSLSNKLEGMLLRPVEEEAIETPEALSRQRLVQFVPGGSLLDLKEKFEIKKAKKLQYATFRVRIINIEKAVTRASLYFEDARGDWSKASKIITIFPATLLAIDFSANTRYLKKSVQRYLNIEKSLHMMSGKDFDAVFEVDTFPYFSHNYYLGLTNYEFDKHSLIVGASGSGKSKLISLFVERLYETQLKMNYRVVIIDPHASLADDFGHITSKKVVAFGKEDSTDLFPGAETDLSSATELTATLFKSILGDQFTPRLDKLLRFSLFVLMTAQTMSLENLRRFLTEVDYRQQLIKHVKGFVPDNVEKFFGADYNEYRTKYYNETILPLVSMVDEMQLQPSLVNENHVSLARTIQQNFLTVFSLNKVRMGDRVVKTVAGLLIQQIFLLAQARAFGEKILLFIDEVSVVQNPTLAQILAEARKFNLTVVLTQQYFGQVEKPLRESIFANVLNYYTFKVSEEDARMLEGNLNIELPKEILEAEHDKGVSEAGIKVKIMTELHPRECLVRVMSNGQVAPCFKARTVDLPEEILQEKNELKPFPQKLPERFVERGLEPSATQEDSSVSSRVRFTSIRDLLAAHSSSRLSVNKKEKDNS